MGTVSSTSKSEGALERESVSAGAAGGAALGAVIALTAFSTATGLLPVIGGLAIGAASGGGIGHFVNTAIKKRRRPAYIEAGKR